MSVSGGLSRFSLSVRASRKVSSPLSLYEDEAALMDVIRRKRERKKAQMSQREKTVGDIIREVSTVCSKQEKQKVSPAFLATPHYHTPSTN